MVLAREEAAQRRAPATPTDLLLGVVVQEQLECAKLLQSFGITATAIRSVRECGDDSEEDVSMTVGRKTFRARSPYSLGVTKVLSHAWQRCWQNNRSVMTVDDILWGILETNDPKCLTVMSSIGAVPNELKSRLDKTACGD
jgi:ATP-dependent Clp protease ATP-binding subunit ClpA